MKMGPKYIFNISFLINKYIKVSPVNCIYNYYSTLHELSFTKLQVLWHNINIYICTGEHDENIIFLHEIDWKIKMNNRHMSLMLLVTLKIISRGGDT